MWSRSKRLAYVVANLFAKKEREEEAKRERESRGITCASITPTPCPLPGLRREEAITVTHLVDSF